MGTRRYVLSVDNDNEFRSQCEWFVTKTVEKSLTITRKKKIFVGSVSHSPQYQVTCLFLGFLETSWNPPLKKRFLFSRCFKITYNMFYFSKRCFKFSKYLGKIIKNHEKKIKKILVGSVDHSPQYQICLFAGFLDGPDRTHLINYSEVHNWRTNLYTGVRGFTITILSFTSVSVLSVSSHTHSSINPVWMRRRDWNNLFFIESDKVRVIGNKEKGYRCGEPETETYRWRMWKKHWNSEMRYLRRGNRIGGERFVSGRGECGSWRYNIWDSWNTISDFLTVVCFESMTWELKIRLIYMSVGPMKD
jgi:hypothetical protein